MNHYLSGVGRALMFYGSRLIGTGKTLTESTFSFSATPTEIRAGEGNALQGRFFHDSNLAVTISDAMFRLEDIALKLGVNVEQGGLAVYESGAEGETVALGGTITADQAPIAFDGVKMVWYKKVGEDEWKVTTQVSDKTITIPSAKPSEVYCIKYFWQNENAKMMTIPTQFNPSELHIVLIHDLFKADNGGTLDGIDATKVGRLITDIPRLQLDPNLELNLTPTTSAPVSISGTAMAVNSGKACEEQSSYGTMTEEIYGASWKDNVIALAVENGEMELGASGDKETLVVRAVFNGMPSQRKDNSNFTFRVDSGSSAQVEPTGIVTSQASDGVTVIEVSLTGKENVDSTYVKVNVTGNS